MSLKYRSGVGRNLYKGSIKYQGEEKSNVNYITGKDVTIRTLQKNLSDARMLVAIDVHSTITNHDETVLLPESRVSINKILQRGYPIYLATNGVWSPSMKRQLDKTFIDAPKGTNIIVLDWHNRGKLQKDLDMKNELYDKIDVIRLMEYINPTAALVLFDNSRHNITAWKNDGRLGILVKGGLTIQSVKNLHSDEDLDVDLQDGIQTLKGIQKAKRTNTYYDFYNDTFVKDLTGWSKSQISTNKNHPVVGNLMVYYNIWVPMMKAAYKDFLIQDNKPKTQKFKVLFDARGEELHMGRKSFLDSERMTVTFGLAEKSKKEKKEFYNFILADLQRDLDSKFDSEDVNFSIEYDNIDLYLIVTQFNYRLVHKELNRNLIIERGPPILYEDEKRNQIGAIFQTMIQQAGTNKQMMWVAILQFV